MQFLQKSSSADLSHPQPVNAGNSQVIGHHRLVGQLIRYHIIDHTDASSSIIIGRLPSWSNISKAVRA
jgi:hypothetical protein